MRSPGFQTRFMMRLVIALTISCGSVARLKGRMESDSIESVIGAIRRHEFGALPGSCALRAVPSPHLASERHAAALRPDGFSPCLEGFPFDRAAASNSKDCQIHEMTTGRAKLPASP